MDLWRSSVPTQSMANVVNGTNPLPMAEPSIVTLADPFESREKAKPSPEPPTRRVLHFRLPVALAFFVPLVLAVLSLSCYIWYVTYHRKLAEIEELSDQFNRQLIASTGTGLDNVFAMAENQVASFAKTLETAPGLSDQICQNWTSELKWNVEMHLMAPLFVVNPRFTFVSVGQAIAVDGVMIVRDMLAFFRYNGTYSVEATYEFPFVELRSHDAAFPALPKSDWFVRYENPIYPVGSVDGVTECGSLEVVDLPDLYLLPMWETPKFTFSQALGVLSVNVNFLCPSIEGRPPWLIYTHLTISITDFSKILAEAVQGRQRMFLTLQQPEGVLLGTSHGKYYSHADSSLTHQELVYTHPDSIGLRWYSPQDCNDLIIHSVATVLYGQAHTWDLHNVDTTVHAAGEDWIVLSRTLRGPGRTIQLWLLQDAEILYGDVKRSITASLFVFIGFAAGSVIAGLLLAYVMVYPLSSLRGSMDKMTTDELANIPVVAMKFSRVEEVFCLQRSYLRMLSVLRSFSRYVPTAVVKQMLKHPTASLQSFVSRCGVTVMFMDVNGFTQLSMVLSDDQVLLFLSRVHQHSSAIIVRNKGLIDKFIGDTVMALWGASGKDKIFDERSSAISACQAVSECLITMTKGLRTALFRDGLPIARFRVGMHSGSAIVGVAFLGCFSGTPKVVMCTFSIGNIGCEHRYNFTAVGDTVNVASRLMAANKMFGTSAIVSETVAEVAKAEFQFAILAPIQLCGRGERLKAFEFLCPSLDGGTIETVRNAVREWEKGMAHYRARDFARAEMTLEDLSRFISATNFFVQRCRQHRTFPPPVDWDDTEVQEFK